MRKIILFLLFTVSIPIFLKGQSDVTSQDKINYLYAIRLTNFQFNITYSEDGICSNSVEVSANLNDNTRQTMLNFSDHNYSFSNRIFFFNKKMRNLHIYAESVDKTNRPWPLSDSCDQDAKIEQDTPTASDCNSGYFEATGNHSDVKNKILFTYMLIPLHTLNAKVTNGVTNTLLPARDKVTLYAKEGFSPNLYHYQYRIEGETLTWSDIPTDMYNAHKLTLSGKELFDAIGKDHTQYIGKKVEFRVVSCYEGGTYLSFSDPIFLTLLESSPHILSHPVAPTKCYDSEDGTVTLNFDRSLLTGEKLEASLVDSITGAVVRNIDFTATLESSTSFTIEDLSPGKYRLDLQGEYMGHQTYAKGDQHIFNFEVTRPTAVKFSSTSKTDIFCHEGSDGIINLSATGGQNVFQYTITGDNGIDVNWTNFNSGGNASITSLPAGTYKIKVRDSNECLAKESGVEKVITVILTEPTAAIALTEIDITEPTGYGLKNGYISVCIKGGTPKTDGTYNFEWRKDSPSGTIVSTGITTDAINNPYTIKLGDIYAGKYYLTVTDNNYAGASSNLGSCGIISYEFEVSQPDSLIATIEVQKIISCNINNDYAYKLDLDDNGVPDEAENGILKAVVTGGVGAYTYQWQKLDDGVYTNIPNATTNTLAGLTEGNYQILVKDVNDNRADDAMLFSFPATLQISLSANTIRCNNQNEGEISVVATGGRGEYNYTWSTTDTTPFVSGLGAGNYFVVVEDSCDCKVTGNIRIEQPGQLEIEDLSVQDPVCNGASNGTIQIKASGGKTPYNIAWSNGLTGENLYNLAAGTYSVTFTDANGCIMTKEYILHNPDALTIDLGEDITLCKGDSMIYNITIEDPATTYRWENDKGDIIGTNPVIALSEAGTYTALMIDSKGCAATDKVTISNSEEVLSPEFLMTTHAYTDYTVELVNTSPVKPEKVEWVLPDTEDIEVLSSSDEHMSLKFRVPGSYIIGLRGMQGLCDKTQYRHVVVEENIYGVEEPSLTASNIEEFIITPNPNNGNYVVKVKLYKEDSIKLRVVHFSGKDAHQVVNRPKSRIFEVPFNQAFVVGSYLVILETGNEVLVKKMLIE